MALFKKSRQAGKERSAATPPESIETLRRRAWHRLLGATVLVLLGILGFPLLFNTQPRPVSVNVPIEIPDKDKASPLVTPAVAPEAPPPAQEPARPSATGPEAKQEAPASGQAATVSEQKPVDVKTPPQSTAIKSEAPKPAEPKPSAKPGGGDDGLRAQALLEGKDIGKEPTERAEGRFVVQVGAFADAAKVRETRQRLEKAGLKTYTQVIQTKDGPRIRVRVGPFVSRAEASKVVGRIKALELPAAILSL